MDIGRAITFPFDDEDWLTKTIIGTLLNLIPFVGQGYQVSVARNVMRGEEHPLPGGEDVGQVITDAIMTVIAWFIYFFPLIIMTCLLLFPAIVMGETILGGVIFCFSSTCLFILGVLYLIPAMALYWMGIIRYAESGNFSEFMQIGALWRDVMDHASTLGMLLVYAIVLVIAASVISMAVFITCIGGPLVFFFYQIATGHLIGQAGIEIAGGLNGK